MLCVAELNHSDGEGHIITAAHVIDCRGYIAADEVEETGIALHSTMPLPVSAWIVMRCGPMIC